MQNTSHTKTTLSVWVRPLVLTISLLVGALVLGLVLYYFILWASWDYNADFLRQEACLTRGGVWSVDQQRCWYAGVCEDEGGFWYPIESRCVFDATTVGQ